MYITIYQQLMLSTMWEARVAKSAYAYLNKYWKTICICRTDANAGMILKTCVAFGFPCVALQSKWVHPEEYVFESMYFRDSFLLCWYPVEIENIEMPAYKF